MRHHQSAMERAHFLIDLDREEAAAMPLYGERGIRRTFLEFDEIRNYERALPGVSWETILALPLNPARTVVDGKHMVAILCHDPMWGWNIAAWCVNAPADFYVWRFDCGGFMLGREQLEEHLLIGTAPQLLQTPLEWLQNDMKGIVIL